MIKKVILSLIILSFVAATHVILWAQTIGDPNQGDPTFRKKGYMNGNKVNSIFYNYGLVGDIPPEISGEWPTGTANEYVGDVSPMIGVEYIGERVEAGMTVIDTIISVVTSDGPRGGSDGPPGGGIFWGFEPIPGYADPLQDFVATSSALDNDGQDGIPGSTDDDGKPDSWPWVWPDQPTWVDQNGVPEWNGFFGRDVMSADLESYFRFDDSRDEEFPIYPSSIDSTRRGLGFEIKGRGLQWAHFMAEDCIFWLYEIINEGDIDYDKVAFGMMVGTLSGGRGDSHDDLAYFDLANDITYSWDEDDVGSPGWVPVSDTRNVGYVGYAYLESPGVNIDGIDNDGDADSLSSAPRFTEADFGPRSLNPGMTIFSIDPQTFERSPFTVPNQTFDFESQGVAYQLFPGQTVQEIEEDVYDNDFDGLINESFEAHYNQLVNPPPDYELDPQPALRHVDYETGAGLNDPMLDEGRFDGIDNDGDWDPAQDDVGEDGKPNSGDFGEGNGIPDAGEPHFDQTDVDESDQIGLTSFDYFSPPGQIRMSSDIQLWEHMTPGLFDVAPGVAEDGDFLYGSGYFPVFSGNTQWFSVSLVYGEDFDDILNNKITVQTIYDENYNFARPPEKPKVRAFAGDGYVTLYWDSDSEASFDPVMGYDFEGYKIYRATDPAFNEINTITDGFGRKIFYDPLATFDIYNEYEGFFPIDYQGVQFYLGKNNGLRHSYTDSTVVNGQLYYYAVTAYDRGNVEKDVFPAETTRSILLSPGGDVTLDVNTIMVKPNAPVSGYIPPSGEESVEHTQGSATGDVFLSILDPTIVPDNRLFEIVFEDSSFFQRGTVNYSVFDVTDIPPDTIIFKSDNLSGESDALPNMGMRLTFRNDWNVLINPDLSGWNSDESLPEFSIKLLSLCDGDFVGVGSAFDYEITVMGSADYYSEPFYVECFGYVGDFPSVPINFIVRNASLDKEIKVIVNDSDSSGTLNKSDEVFFVELNEDTGEEQITWYLKLKGDGNTIEPEQGDVLTITTFTPFNRDDRYRFTSASAKVTEGIGESVLDDIKVVPNPYTAVAEWEVNDPYRQGRGDRHIDFIHVPEYATIRIYSVRGELVRTLKHEGGIFDGTVSWDLRTRDGTVSWDLRTRDGLNAAYGIYVYHIDAPGIGEKIDKFAIIK
ncbi:MAG: hypothetical protein B6244_13655 [Candidatus Cloacimonetes bacterium 4572_55]|nr:MAG: hypothetical protein B6244_13655 [Candidatus Cloacimonetes bacterium 4572_55]